MTLKIKSKKKKRVNMPCEVKNDSNSISDLLKLLYNLIEEYKINKYDIVEFNFRSTRWFEANLTALLATTFEKLFDINKDIAIYLEGVNNSIETIFMKNGFYELYNLGKKEDIFDSTIPFTTFGMHQEEAFTDYLDNDVLPKIDLDRTDEEQDLFKTCLQEVFENVRMHANSSLLYSCGQYFHTKKKVAFTLADLGITIGENVRRKLGISLADHDAIEWATQFGNTTKLNEDGGIGLDFLKKYLKDSGYLMIISGNGYWEQTPTGIFSRKAPYRYNGTIINIVTDLTSNIESDVEEIWF